MQYLACYTQIAPYKSGGVLGVGSTQQILETPLWEAVVKVLYQIKQTGVSCPEELLKLCCFPNAKEAINLVFESNLLAPKHEFNPNDRYSRNQLYYRYMGANPIEVQKKLTNASVTILGCGGIGSTIAYYLASSGVGHLTLIDDDIIELSNLTRQVLYTEADIGKAKTKILKRELLKRNHNIKINIQNIQITSFANMAKLKQSDLFIISADKPFGLMNWINEYCVKNQQAYLNIGYINDISVIGPFYIPKKTACLACHKITPEYNGEGDITKLCNEINKDFRPASFPGVNGVAAAYGFNEAIKFLGDFGEILSKNKRIGIHSVKPEFEFQTLTPNSRCLICSTTAK